MRKLLPGLLLILALTLVAYFLSSLVQLGGKHPLEASALAVILGIVLRNSLHWRSSFDPGLKSGEKLLIWGIVLMGAALNFSQIKAQGAALLAVISVTMLASFAVIVFLAQKLRISPSLSILLAVGTTICGGTAIAVTAPLIRAPEEETSYAVMTIALWGVLAILLYPPIAQMLGASDFAFGVFSGTAIHSTPQVVGAGFIFSETAGTTATAVKLVRNCFMAPLALLIALWSSWRSGRAEIKGKELLRAFPWFLFGFFVLSWLGSSGYLAAKWIAAASETGKFLIVMGMAGIGLNTPLTAIRAVGPRPLLVGFLGALVVALISVTMIRLAL